MLKLSSSVRKGEGNGVWRESEVSAVVAVTGLPAAGEKGGEAAAEERDMTPVGVTHCRCELVRDGRVAGQEW